MNYSSTADLDYNLYMHFAKGIEYETQFQAQTSTFSDTAIPPKFSNY